MRKIFPFICILFVSTACFEIHDIDFKGVENVKLDKMDKNAITLQLSVKVDNPNGFNIKIKPSTLDVFADEVLLGQACLDQKVKIVRKKEDAYLVPVRINLEDGILFKLMKFKLKDKVQVRVKGMVKGSVFGYTKKVEVDEVKEIAGKDFKFDAFSGGGDD